MIGAQPATNLPASAVEDNRLLRRHVHRQIHPRYRRRLDLEVHPAPVHPPVLCSNPFHQQNPRALVHLEKASTLQCSFIRPVPRVRQSSICKCLDFSKMFVQHQERFTSEVNSVNWLCGFLLSKPEHESRAVSRLGRRWFRRMIA